MQYTLVQYILFAQEENVIHRCSKLTDHNMASNPHQFGPLNDIPHRHRRKEEEASHLYKGDN
jgi:hypothetical protein